MQTDIFEYLDYRKFLRDMYAEQKATSPRFSYRYFSRRAGLGSPSYLKAVMDGKRNLRQETARRFAEALKLDKQETRYFLNLVAMNQASSTRERSVYYEELAQIPRYRRTRRLECEQYDYYSRWYCVAVRELAARADFQEDPAWIARQLRPTISEREAREALALLTELGMLRRGEDGRLRQSDSLLSTGREIAGLVIRRFHGEMLALARTALDRIDPTEREVGGVTVRLTEPQVRHLKERLYELRQEVLQLDAAEDGDQAVYHMSFQLFPLTRFGGGTS